MIGPALVVALLALVYVLVLGSFSLVDILIGVLLASGLRLTLRNRLRSGQSSYVRITLGQVVAFWPFVAAAAWEILGGAWAVLRVAAHLTPMPRSGILAIPIGDRTPVGVAISALTIGLSPGTTLLDVDMERKVMLVHIFDLSDPETARSRIQELYERYQRSVFP